MNSNLLGYYFDMIAFSSSNLAQLQVIKPIITT